MSGQPARHFNSRTVECAECGHIGRAMRDVCDCCAGPTYRPNAAETKREWKRSPKENRQ